MICSSANSTRAPHASAAVGAINAKRDNADEESESTSFVVLAEAAAAAAAAAAFFLASIAAAAAWRHDVLPAPPAADFSPDPVAVDDDAMGDGSRPAKFSDHANASDDSAVDAAPASALDGLTAASDFCSAAPAAADFCAADFCDTSAPRRLASHKRSSRTQISTQVCVSWRLRRFLTSVGDRIWRSSLALRLGDEQKANHNIMK